MKIKPFFPARTPHPPKGVTVVELSERFFKIAQASWGSGGGRLAALVWGEWNPKEEEKAEAVFLAAFRSLPHPTGFLIGSLSRSQVTTRHLLLPSQDPKELKEMLALQMQRQIPFSKGRMVYDYQLLEAAPNGHSHLFSVVAEEDVVTRSLSLLQKTGVTPQCLSFSSWGLLNWFDLHQPRRDGDPFLLFLDVDRWNTQAEIVRRQQLYFSRSFPIGSESLKQAEGIAAFSQGVVHFLSAFKKEFVGATVTSAMVGGVTEALPKVKPLLEELFPSSLELLEPMEGPFISDLLRQTFRESPVSYAAVTGLLFTRRPPPNLLPEPVKQRHRRRWLQQQGVRLLTLAVVFFSLVGFSLRGLLQEKHRYLAHLQKELRQLEPLTSEIASMERELGFLHQRAQQSSELLEAVKVLYETIPSTVSLTFLSIEPGHISFRGICQEISQVFSFAQALETSPQLKKVQVKSTTQRRVQEREAIDFRIDALFETKEGSR